MFPKNVMAKIDSGIILNPTDQYKMDILKLLNRVENLDIENNKKGFISGVKHLTWKIIKYIPKSVRLEIDKIYKDIDEEKQKLEELIDYREKFNVLRRLRPEIDVSDISEIDDVEQIHTIYQELLKQIHELETMRELERYRTAFDILRSHGLDVPDISEIDDIEQIRTIYQGLAERYTGNLH